MNRRLLVEADGGSRGNPGAAGYGAVVRDARSGEVLAEVSESIGRATNNVAEYQALLHALSYAIEQGAKRVTICSDSELVVRQMEGAYKVKHPSMVPLHREAKALLARFEEARIRHVPREENREADRLANEAVDKKDSKLK